MILSGSAVLTSGITDPVGDGYLQLTDNTTDKSGSAHSEAIFNSNQGIMVEFEYFVHDGIPFNGLTGDGFCFFLFDADVPFSIGAFGGSLGYANNTVDGINGLNGAYIGIGLDAFGIFSTDFEKNDGLPFPNIQPGAVVIRGPGQGSVGYLYGDGTGVQTTSLPQPFQLVDNTTGRDPLPTGAGYRKVKITMEPQYSGSTVSGYLTTIIITTGGATPTDHTVINNFAYNFTPPARMRFGFAGSTGDATNFNEIRNLVVNVFDTLTLIPPVANNDTLVGCINAPLVFDPLANDSTSNGPGVIALAGENINRSTINFDPMATTLRQTLVLADTGTFVADMNGVVTFTPDPAFSGSFSVNYSFTDVYGALSTEGEINITVQSPNAAEVTVSSPQVACAPAGVDISASSGAWSVNPAGGTTTIYTDAAGTNVVSDPSNITQAGTYYVIHTDANNCRVVMPVVVTISSAATSPVATGSVSCGPGDVTLQASGAAAGEDYNWYDVSTGGSPVAQGSSFVAVGLTTTTPYWVTKFALPVGCESARVPVTAVVNPIPATPDAGPDQQLSDAYTIQLAGSALLPGQSGLWTLVSGPNIPVIIEPTIPGAQVTGLVQGIYEFEWTVQSGTCTSSATVTVEILSVLPVTLTMFNAELMSATEVALRWTTVFELNNSHFIVERSSDGINFTEIGQVPGRVNSNERVDYVYNDRLSNLWPGKLYYRLRQVDLDGGVGYSRVIPVSLPDGNGISVWPNPFISNLRLQINEQMQGRLSIVLIAPNGARIYQQTVNSIVAPQTILLNDLPVFSRGMYLLQIMDESRRIKVLKLMRQ